MPVDLSPTATARTAPSAADLQVRFESLIERELVRCKRSMTPADWIEHRDWIEANARASLLDAMRARAVRGEL